jgi:hypothetical protein
MSGRRPTAVYSTAVPWQTGPMAPLQRAPRRTAAILPPQATGTRDPGGVIGAAFSLPSFDTNESTPPGPIPSPTPPGSPTEAASDCCG